MNMKKQNQPTPENQDFIAAYLANLVRFCKKNKNALLTACGVLLVAFIIGTIYTNRQQKLAEDSWAAYYNAQIAFASQGEAVGFEQLEKVATDFPNSNAALYALLQKGDMLYAQENYAQAIEVYKRLTPAKNETIHTVATLSEAAALQATNDYENSISLLNDFIAKNQKSFALPQAYLTLAMSQELAGKKEDALNTYKHILEAYTKTYFGTVAKEKLAELQK